MVWFKTDDAFWRHRKVRKLGKDKIPAVGLWGLSGPWCAENGTDGFIPAEQIKAFGDTKLRYATRLVDVGLWSDVEHDGEIGYRFNGWDEYQPLAEEVTKRRIEDQMRKDLYARPGLVQAIKDRDRNLCRFCGIRVRWSDRRSAAGGTIDHLMPVSRGGKNELENLAVACRSCNSRKGDRTPSEAGMLLLPPGTPIGGTSSGTKSELDETQDQGQNGTGERQSPVPGPVPVGTTSRGEGHLPARASAPPPRCPKHATSPAPGPCRACADARQARAEYDTAQAEQAEAERLAISRCRLCDGDGRRWDPVSKARGTVGPCNHQPIPRQETA